MKLAALALLVMTSLAHATPTQAQLKIDRAETAAKVFASTVAMQKSGRATTEAVYVWSVRWLDSELDRATTAKAKKQALVDHAARMAELETAANTQRDAGIATPTDAMAASYARIEADLWVLAGKAH